MQRFVFIHLILLSQMCLGEDLFSSVFGNREYIAEIPTFINKTSIGDVNYKIKGEKISLIESKTLNEKLKLVLKEKHVKELSYSKKWVSPLNIPFKIIYDPKNLVVVFEIQYSKLKPTYKFMDNNPKLQYAGNAIEPAALGGGVNLRAERRAADEFFGGRYQSLFHDSFLNIHGYVFESQGFYEDNLDDDLNERWIQGDKSLTKDFESYRVRARLGDSNSFNFGFLNSYQLGGAKISKQFSIDPYNKPFPQGQEEFQLFTRSRVKTFVNGSLIKDEFLPAGNYRLTNLPLINGLNFVRLEIIDEFGSTKVVEYNIATAISLLSEGETNYSFSYGKPFTVTSNQRSYEDKNLFSGFYQKGVNSYYTTAGYFQNYEDFSLLGTNHGFSTRFGNIFYELAYSQNSFLNEKETGLAHSINYQLQLQGQKYFNGLSTIIRYENFENDFNNTYTVTTNKIKESLDLSFSLPLFKKLTLNLGGGIATYQNNNLPKRRRVNLTANWRVLRSLNINFFTSKLRDFSGEDALSSSVFLTWSFDNSNKYVTAYRDIENEQTRITITNDNNNELYHPLINVSLDQDDQARTQSADLNLRLPTPMLDLNLRGAIANDENAKNRSLQALTLGTSFLFAYDKELSYAIARPNSSSFALFKSIDGLEDQNIKIRSTSPYADTSTPLVGDLALTNLVPYQYRVIEIDPSNLDLGVSLKREKFVIKPTYKSTHLLLLEPRGLISVKGRFMKNSKALALEVGKLNGDAFFTDREGNFYVDGIEKGTLEFKFNGYKVFKYQLKDKENGIINLGNIRLEESQE